MKFYAYYGTIGEYEILSEKQYTEIMQNLQQSDEGKQIDYYQQFNKFDSFIEARSHLIMHLQGDIQDAKWALREVRALKARNFKD